MIRDVQLATGAEVEAIDAGAQVGAVRLHALHCEHTHADLVGAPRLARQLTQRPAALIHAWFEHGHRRGLTGSGEKGKRRQQIGTYATHD